MQRALFKKLLRDILHLRGQIFATALVVACGVASFVAMRSTYSSLLATQQNYYSEYRFGDVFAHLTRAPKSVRRSIEQIPGIAAVQTRIVSSSILDLADLPEPAQGRIVSIPERRSQILNDLHIVRGRYINSNAPNEVIVSGAFAEANGFDPGDKFDAIMNGRRRRVTIVGIGLSPEYVYEIRPGDIFPDNRRFGIIWINEDEAAAAFDLDDSFNDVSATLAPGASVENVVERMDAILRPYGGSGAYPRSEQASYRFISNEFKQLQTFGSFLPAIFLGVTAFLLHLVLSRLVATQREQIGLLKAFGYTDTTIGIHFLSLAFAAVLGGIVAGILLGMWMGNEMTKMYADYFRFPVLTFQVGWTLPIVSVLITLGSASIGAISAVRKAALLPPAEAMRPEAPTSFKAGLLERSGLRSYLSPANRIVVRNLSRQPFKALISVLGISAAAALLFTGFYFYDAIDQIIQVQFVKAIRENAVVTFNLPRPQRARLEIEQLPGVIRTEAFRGVSARLVSEHRSRRLGLMGVEQAPDLQRVVDKDGVVRSVPAAGLLLSAALADLLDVDVGDTLTVEVLEGSRPVKQIEVAAVVNELMGLNAYIDIRALNRMLSEDDVISGTYLMVDQRYKDSLYSRLKQMPGVAGVSLPGTILESFNETFAKTIGIFTFVLVLFSGAIVFGVVYNAARIALSERGRELASLRVLGFTKREIAMILLSEHAVLTAIAIPIGFIFGFVICITMNNLVDNELMRLPLVFSRKTLVSTALFVTGAALVSGLLVAWRVGSLDLIAVLKTRE